MTLYLDTSALVKLYVEEEFSDWVLEWTKRAERIASSGVAYAEMASALRRIFQEERISAEDLRRVWKAFKEDWEGYTRVWLTQEVANLAADLIFRYRLKGFDGIHLASASLLKDVVGKVVFVSFDRKLNEAAASETLEVLKV
ncbi:type II toxin-antitoxin system VapC family toxin [Thermosulfurimonas sp.]|uniref:type II toxin-antitoxin system VapC family toxin n=1 Tax=Thermosulfurimonas sp. TaxID=2080236 RepID=UPI0025E97917|nr:type II toxin-antitoxin system VapC family toxin [Thermosulfurimonas sp.]